MGQDKLKGLRLHGLRLAPAEQGRKEMRTDCPFCDKPNHLYLNTETTQWECKRCGESGNFYTLLTKFAGDYLSPGKDESWRQELSKRRGFPESAFRGTVGWSGSHLMVPVRNAEGAVVDIRWCKLGGKLMSTPGVSVGLFGHEQLTDPSRLAEPVFICEGEWDALALRYLLKGAGVNGVAVGVPGAAVFKQGWTSSFVNRDVFVCMDNDEAGDTGAEVAGGRLRGVARSVKHLHWSGTLPKGHDVSDHVRFFLRGKGQARHKLKRCWKLLGLMFNTISRKQLYAPSSGKPGGKKKKAKAPAKRVVRAASSRLIHVFRHWLFLKSEDAIRVVFGTVLANRMEGDPLWLFLVAPPGGTKTELLLSLSQSPDIHTTTSLTPHSLVSGANFLGGGDPSLIPQLDGKVLVIKDFTTILSMHYIHRDEIFGILRDAYDGKTEKQFGTGVKRSYTSRFGILAGVTTTIDRFSTIHQSLGERFLKFRDYNAGVTWEDESARIARAMENINQENSMRSALAQAAATYLNLASPEKWPTLSKSTRSKLIYLAQLTGILRSVVERDNFGNVVFRPVAEVGTRLGKQLAKLLIGLTAFRGADSVHAEDYQIVSKVALDTVPDRVTVVVRELWRTRKWPGGLTTKEVGSLAHLPPATCFREMQDLEMLSIVQKKGDAQTYRWMLTQKLSRLLENSGAFNTLSNHAVPKDREVRVATTAPRKREKRKG